MTQKVTLYEEQVAEGKKARWPYNTTLPNADLYTTIMNRVKQDKIGYIFEGWMYDGQIRREPFTNEESDPNPFGPIIHGETGEPIEIMAMWSKIYVYCVRTPNETVAWQGETVTVTYYATVGNQTINSNEVTLHVDSATTASYTIGTDTTSGNFRTCQFTFAQNSSRDGKYLVLYAKYKGVESERLRIYQTNQYEVVIPDSDYFLFNYNWTENDGKDLDSLTVITVRDENNQIVETSFSGKPIGFRRSANVVESNNSLYKVFGDNELLCLRHSQDNTQSGAEGAVVCLTNIANTGEVSVLDTIYVDIYANWYLSKNQGNMEIVCKGYKHKSKQTSPDYNTDIIETPNTLPFGGTYYSFSPNSDNCEVSWSGYSYPDSGQSFKIEAQGSENAEFENSFIPYLGNLYSHVATVIYNIGTGVKTFNIRTQDNGVDRDDHKIRLMYNNQSGAIYNKFTYPDGGQTGVVIDNVYLNYYSTEGNESPTWDGDKFMFTNDNDKIMVNYYKEDEGKIPNFTITKENLGTTYYSTAGGATPDSYLNNLIITQNQTTKKIKIQFDITNANNKKRNVDLIFVKVSDDGHHPFACCRINIWQNES